MKQFPVSREARLRLAWNLSAMRTWPVVLNFSSSLLVPTCEENDRLPTVLNISLDVSFVSTLFETMPPPFDDLLLEIFQRDSTLSFRPDFPWTRHLISPYTLCSLIFLRKSNKLPIAKENHSPWEDGRTQRTQRTHYNSTENGAPTESNGRVETISIDFPGRTEIKIDHFSVASTPRSVFPAPLHSVATSSHRGGSPHRLNQ